MVKVSVIIPAYNVEPYLERCLRSVAEQTLEGMEIIVINDGSTDRTEEIACRLREEYPKKLIVKTTENQGAATARNEGLALARGEYIGFVDADDTVCPSMFERMYQEGVRTKADIVCCGYLRADGADLQNRGVDSELCRLYGKSIFEEPRLLTESTPYLWNKIFRRSMIEKRRIVFQDYQIYEDLVFTYQSFLYAGKIAYVPLPLYQYMVSRDGALTSSFSAKRFDLFRAFDRLYSCYEEEGAAEKFAGELFFILIKHVYVVCEETSGPGRIKDKFRFIRESFDYLRKVYPGLKEYTYYYQVYGNRKSWYEKKSYWYLRTIFPWVRGLRRKMGKVKRAAGLGRRPQEIQDELPQENQDMSGAPAVLLLWDPLLSPEKYEKLQEEIRLLQEKGTPCLYLYERDRVLGRQEMVTRLAKSIPCREWARPFSSLRRWERVLMAFMEYHPWLYALLRWKGAGMMKREFQRILPDTVLSGAIVAGDVRLRSRALLRAAGVDRYFYL